MEPVWHWPPQQPFGPVPLLPWHFTHTPPLAYTASGCPVVMKLLLCGKAMPWHAVQNELLWHLVQRPGEDSAVDGCAPSQPAGCGICRP